MFAKNVLSWDATNGYKLTGSCELTCTAAAFSTTGNGATSGTTCASTVYGNEYTTAQMDVVDVKYCWNPDGNSGNGQSDSFATSSNCCVVKKIKF